MLGKRFVSAIVVMLVAVPGTAYSRSIVVKAGDTLSGLAQRELGSGGRWPELCETNNLLLQGECDDLPIGLILELPTADNSQPVVEAPPPTVHSEAGEATAVEVSTDLRADANRNDQSDNLLQFPGDLTNGDYWAASNGLSILVHPDGVFELVTGGTKDPILQQRITGAPAGKTYQFNIEAKAGNSAGAIPALRLFGYVVHMEDLVNESIKIGDLQPLTSEFVPLTLEVPIDELITEQFSLVFRLDPGDGMPNGTNVPPDGYSLFVRNPSVVVMNK